MNTASPYVFMGLGLGIYIGFSIKMFSRTTCLIIVSLISKKQGFHIFYT